MNQNFEKSVSIYFTKDDVIDDWAFIQAWSVCGPYGPHIWDGPVLTVAKGDDQALGEGILKTLQYCRYGIPIDSWKGAEKPLYDALAVKGLKGKKKIDQYLKTFEVEFLQHKIKIIPKKTDKKGSVSFEDRIITLDQADLTPERLGAAVKKAFSLCE